MIRCLLILTFGFVFTFAKYVPTLSSSYSEVPPYHNKMDHFENRGRRLIGDDDGIDSYRRHRYYNITTRVGHEHLYGWKEINETGIRSSVSDVDDVLFERVQLNGWSFRFYGHLHTELFISANGFLTVMPDYSEGPCGRAFCEWSGHYYTRYIAPLMTDWYPGNSNSSQVYYQHGQNPDGEHYLVVEWDGITLWSNNHTYDNAPFSFQVIIEEDGDVIFNYKSLPFDPHSKMLVQNEFRFNYPVNIGLEDCFIYHSEKNPRIDGTKWTYYPLQLTFDNITHSQGRSIRMEALPTCQQFATCETCVNYTNSVKGDPNALECGYCGAINVCSDDIGREIASEADSCMSERSQMQTSVTQCKMFNANYCGQNRSTDGWPRTEPGKVASRACAFDSKVEMECPLSACFQTRECNRFGDWLNITTQCDRNQTLSPCPAFEGFGSSIPGNVSSAPCEGESGRLMFRYCNFYGQWSDIDVSSCSEKSAGLTGGDIAGITTGSIIAVLIIGVLFWMLRKSRKDFADFKFTHLNDDDDTSTGKGIQMQSTQ